VGKNVFRKEKLQQDGGLKKGGKENGRKKRGKKKRGENFKERKDW